MKFIAGALLIAAIAVPASADTILFNDFQNFSQGNWIAAGHAPIGTSAYKQNVTLRLTGGGAATNTISTSGYKDVSVALGFSALDLGAHGGCIADASIDGGTTWIRIYRIAASSGDGVTLHTTSKALPELDNQAKVILRLTNTGPAESNCWADDVSVTGTPNGGPRAPAAPSGGGAAPAAAPAPSGNIVWDPSSVPAGPLPKPHK